jgi:predicted Zn-dependent protease
MPPETKSSAAWRWSYAWALYAADRCDEAYNVAQSLAEEFPEDLWYRGLAGVLAARRGDQEEAQQVSHWLEALERPYLRGDHTMWRSLIAAAKGDGENAVALFRQAVAQGMTYPRTWDAGWIAFEPIRDYPPWQEFIRPKG